MILINLHLLFYALRRTLPFRKEVFFEVLCM
jgi:hypothetical protein